MPTVLSLFSGAGGLDLGFEFAGFDHLAAIELDPWAFATLANNRPNWNPQMLDAREFHPVGGCNVLIAGPPCQGFSLGGNRVADDPRNTLYREVIRVAEEATPQIVIIENVLNLRTMRTPDTDQPFVEVFTEGLEALGYEVRHGVFKMSEYGVPQTRRRFIFFGVLGGLPPGFEFPPPDAVEETIHDHIIDLATAAIPPDLPNHQPDWTFKSRVHTATGAQYPADAPIVPIRISRTSSDGNPLRSYDSPFPAVDTATLWGFAQGNVVAQRVRPPPEKKTKSKSKYANPPLWRIGAARMRKMTPREFARLQTFPDDWEFIGGTAERDILKQIGNAVPVAFAQRLGEFTAQVLDALDADEPLQVPVGAQMALL